jgi:hypothetical protein
LELLFGGNGGTRIDATQLRTVIKPVYRQVFELLSGHSAAEANGILSDVPLLAETAEGLRFLPAADVLYAATPGLRERSGVVGSVPTFVLEAESGATAPLTRLFGVRVLESVLEWHPDPGESPLDPDELSEFRRELCDLVPALLARIRVERANDDDKRVLLEFAERIEPVDALRLTCTLDGVSIDRVRDRSYFVRPPVRNEPLQAFVEWHGPAWPPNGADAQALAMALADALGANLVETFLAFIQSDKVQRMRLLDIAGASGFLADAVGDLAERHSENERVPSAKGPDRTPDPFATSGTTESSEPSPTVGKPAPPPVPLVRFEDLIMDGEPVIVFGERSDRGSGLDDNEPPGANGTSSKDSNGHSRRFPLGIDLAALDRLGMRIAIGYEVRRLRRRGLASADLLVPDNHAVLETSFVVDVHNPEAIRRAEDASSVVRTVMKKLEDGA